MIKNLRDWRKESAKLLDDNITSDERKTIHDEMEKFENKHQSLFRKIHEDGLRLSLSDLGS